MNGILNVPSYLMNKIIPFDKEYEFAFIEEKEINIMHPVSNYYFKLDDLSINLLISLKWIEWGYIFLKEISKALEDCKEDFKMCDIISKSISKIEEIEGNKIILIDDEKINNEDDYYKLIDDVYMKDIFDTNTKIHMKLKMNLREYLIISNMLFLVLVKPKK